METPPKPSTVTFVMSTPHHAWGLVGLGVLLVGVRLALSRPCGVTTRWCSCIGRRIRFLLTGSFSTKRRYAQILREPQNGCSALSWWLRGSRAASRWVTWSERCRVGPTARRLVVTLT